MFTRRKSLLGSLLAWALLSGCSLVPDLNLPQTKLPTVQESKSAAIDTQWWKAFGDAKLDTLIEEALAHNSDLLLAASNVSLARAALGLKSAELYPNIYATAQAQQVNTSANSYGSSGDITYDSYTLSGVLSYEIDLWGQLSHARDAALKSLLAQEATKDTVRLALVTNVCELYFGLVTMQNNLQVTKEALESREAALVFKTKQFKLGVVNELVVHQIKADLEATKVAFYQLKQQYALTHTAFSKLLGRSPKALIEDSIEHRQNLPATQKMPAWLPSDLLVRRPDIKAALLNLEAANLTVGSAKAAYFPSFSLTGSAGMSAQTSGDLFASDSQNFSVSAGLNLPIFSFGRISANIERAKALKESMITQYEKTVRNAFGEVLDSLNTYENSLKRLNALDNQVTALRKALMLAEKKFDAGYSDYLEVLDARRLLLNAQMGQNSAKLEALTAYITMYKALGGGWENKELN